MTSNNKGTGPVFGSQWPQISRRAFGISSLAAATLWQTPFAFGATGKGGTVVTVIGSDPPTLNPAITSDYTTGDVCGKIFEGLVWLDANFQPQPALATSWTIAPDGKTYSFKLREGVAWHDGHPFSSVDVAYTFNEALAKLHPRSSATLKQLDVKIATPSTSEVTFTLKEPYAPFMKMFWVFDAPIIPRHIFDGSDIKNNAANLVPVGTGPFKFAEWKRGASIKLVRNDNYWDRPKPALDAIIFSVIPQAANRTTGLETGEIDLLVDFYLAKPDVPRLRANKKIAVTEGRNIPAIWFLSTNMNRPAFAKKEARQALAFAIDRNRLVKQAMNGLARPGAGAFGDGFKWAYNEADGYAKKYPLNPAKAKTLLASAGVAPNTQVRLVYDSARPDMEASAQIIRDNLRQVGLDVQLVPLERSVMLQKVYTEHDFDLTLQSYVSSGDPAIGYHRLYRTNSNSAQLTNATGYANPKVDDLLNKASNAPEDTQRAPIYKELQTILNEDLPSLVLFDGTTIDFANKKISGLWKSIDARDHWNDVVLNP